MKAVILSGGNPPSLELLKEELESADYLICADGGANCLFNYNITPNYLIGDFDSISADVLDHLLNSDCIVEKYPKEKDYTDTELALLKAKELGVNKVVFLGCTGSRLDHTIGNIGLLLDCLKHVIDASIKDSNNTMFLSDKSLLITGKKGEYFSLLPYSGVTKNLTIEGSKYNLNNYDLSPGNSLTLSNEFINEQVKISFNGGILLIIKSKD